MTERRSYQERRQENRDKLNKLYPYLTELTEKEVVLLAFQEYRLDPESQLSKDVRAFTKENGFRE